MPRSAPRAAGDAGRARGSDAPFPESSAGGAGGGGAARAEGGARAGRHPRQTPLYLVERLPVTW